MMLLAFNDIKSSRGSLLTRLNVLVLSWRSRFGFEEDFLGQDLMHAVCSDRRQQRYLVPGYLWLLEE